MTIIDQLASSQNIRKEIPNQELAKLIVATDNKSAVEELVAHLNNKNKNIQNDCIKVIYEIGAINPKLIVGFINDFINLLDHQNNRLQWGAMTALNSITNENPKAIYSALTKIIAAADNGSIITNDHCVSILIKLGAISDYADVAFSLLNKRLTMSPTNQLPMYAENALPIINHKNRLIFIKTLSARLSEIEKDSKRLRVEKVIKKANKQYQIKDN